jgi:hypothetical protein
MVVRLLTKLIQEAREDDTTDPYEYGINHIMECTYVELRNAIRRGEHERFGAKQLPCEECDG